MKIDLSKKEKYKIYNQEDLYKIFPFGKTKMNQLFQAGVLPVVKLGRDYITNPDELNKWFEKNNGKELFY